MLRVLVLRGRDSARTSFKAGTATPLETDSSTPQDIEIVTPLVMVS